MGSTLLDEMVGIFLGCMFGAFAQLGCIGYLLFRHGNGPIAEEEFDKRLARLRVAATVASALMAFITWLIMNGSEYRSSVMLPLVLTVGVITCGRYGLLNKLKMPSELKLQSKKKERNSFIGTFVVVSLILFTGVTYGVHAFAGCIEREGGNLLQGLMCFVFYGMLGILHAGIVLGVVTFVLAVFAFVAQVLFVAGCECLKDAHKTTCGAEAQSAETSRILNLLLMTDTERTTMREFTSTCGSLTQEIQEETGALESKKGQLQIVKESTQALEELEIPEQLSSLLNQEIANRQLSVETSETLLKERTSTAQEALSKLQNLVETQRTDPHDVVAQLEQAIAKTKS